MGNPNSSKASRSLMGSNRAMNINVGGGSRKAGLAPTANLPEQARRALGHRGAIQSMRFMMFQADGVTPNVSTVSISRPIGGNLQFNSYWKRR